MRSLMAVWNALYFKKGEYVTDPNKSASWNRGAYSCRVWTLWRMSYTARPFGPGKSGQRKGRQTISGRSRAGKLVCPSPDGDRGTGLKAWSKDEIAEYLKTGRTERVAAVGMMAGVVAKSTQFLTDQDLMAIAEYLKSLPPSNDEKQGHADSGLPSECRV